MRVLQPRILAGAVSGDLLPGHAAWAYWEECRGTLTRDEGPCRTEVAARAAPWRRSKGDRRRGAAVRWRGALAARGHGGAGRAARGPEGDRTPHPPLQVAVGPLPGIPDHASHGWPGPGRPDPAPLNRRQAERELRAHRRPGGSAKGRVRERPAGTASRSCR